MTPPELDAETKARIEAEEAYRAEVRAKHSAVRTAELLDKSIDGSKPPTKKGGSVWPIVGIILALVVLSGLVVQNRLVTTTAVTDSSANQKEASTNSSAETSTLHKVTGTYPACPNAEDYDKLVGFMVEKDGNAAESQYNTSGCIDIHQGEKVYNEGISDLRHMGIVGIRRQGETQVYWTAIEAIQ